MIAGKDAVRHGEAKELVADRDGGVELRGHLPLPCWACAPTSTACASTPCMGGEVGKFHGDAQVPRRRVPHPRQEQRQGAGTRSFTVDGKGPVAGDLVPYAKPGSTVIVECEV